MKKILYLLLAGALAVPSLAGAAYFAADNYVSPTEPISSDIYAAGQSVSVRQPVGDDAFLVGNNVEVTEKVGHSIFAAGQNVTVKGDVGDNVYTAGSAIEVGAAHVKDLFAAGNSVKIDSGTEVSGDAYLAGQTITIDGTISGTVRTAASTIILQPGSTIKGDLITYGHDKPVLTISEGAKILGQQKHIVIEGKTGAQQSVGQMMILGWIRSVATWFVVACVLLYLMPGLSKKVLASTQTKPWPAIGLGALWLLLLIPAIILLFITMIGAPLAVVLMAATVIFIIMAIGYISLVVGVWVMRKLLKQDSEVITWQHALLGAVVVAILGIIPVIGWLAVFILFLLTLGSVSMVITQTLRQKEINLT